MLLSIDTIAMTTILPSLPTVYHGVHCSATSDELYSSYPNEWHLKITTVFSLFKIIYIYEYLVTNITVNITESNNMQDRKSFEKTIIVLLKIKILLISYFLHYEL